MITRTTDSLPPAYFDQKYAGKLDYWDFETSEYEAAKADHALEALPRERYRNAFEIGCSIGVFTERLAGRCDRVFAVDVADRALAAARERCPDAVIERMCFPLERPEGEKFDLIFASEIAYYWARPDLVEAQRALLGLLEPGGDLLLVHWTSEETDHPLTGDEVHESFLACPGFELISHEPRPAYRLDVFRRRKG